MLIKRCLLLAVVALPFSAGAAEIEPGNWEFNINVTAHGLGAAAPREPIVRKRCITAEDAKDPARVLGEAGVKDCKFSNQQDTGSEFSFEVACTTTPVPMNGKGLVRYTRETLDGDLDLAGDARGLKFTTRSKISARRLGPCEQ